MNKFAKSSKDRGVAVKILQRLMGYTELTSRHSPFLFLTILALPIILLFFLDIFNAEGFPAFNSKLMFSLTWKGRLFYVIFLWLVIIEFIQNWNHVKSMIDVATRFHLKIFILAATPILYILGVTSMGLHQTILEIGYFLSIRTLPPDFLYEQWPLSVEYLVILSCSILLIWAWAGKKGLHRFAFPLVFLGGIAGVYLIDTFFPFGTLLPIQLMTLPTAAFATALLNLFGYPASLTYPVVIGDYGPMPVIAVIQNEVADVTANIAWPCAGVHSLFLYVILTVILFRQNMWPKAHKYLYFTLGALGTYGANILRVVSFFLVSLHHGSVAGQTFHNSFGELFFVIWFFVYYLFILLMEQGRIHAFMKDLKIRINVFRSK